MVIVRPVCIAHIRHERRGTERLPVPTNGMSKLGRDSERASHEDGGKALPLGVWWWRWQMTVSVHSTLRQLGQGSDSGQRHISSVGWSGQDSVFWGGQAHRGPGGNKAMLSAFVPRNPFPHALHKYL